MAKHAARWAAWALLLNLLWELAQLRFYPYAMGTGPAGVAWAVYAEWQNVYVRSAWAYAPSMPTIFGIGVLPLLQWVLLPPVVLLLVRRRPLVRASKHRTA